MNTLSLPIPSAAEITRSEALKRKIVADIQKNGPMSFAHYMARCLYEPELGYYAANIRAIGEGGDFVTAPEISSAFAYCLNEEISQNALWPHCVVAEFGAGTGALASQLWQVWKAQNSFPEKYIIIEISEHLRKTQFEKLKETCPEFLERIVWQSSLPNHFEGIIFANEVLDAIPVDCLAIHNHEIVERVVSLDQHQELCWDIAPLSASLKAEIAETQLSPLLTSYNHYHTEWHSQMMTWLKTLFGQIKKAQLIFIDYGYEDPAYYHPERTEGTLRCHYQQIAHDNPFYYPGLQDITAHVNFSRLFELCDAMMIDTEAYVTQAQFLIANGLTDWFSAQQDPDNWIKQKQLSRAVQQLIEPQHMGEIFKVLSLKK